MIEIDTQHLSKVRTLFDQMIERSKDWSKINPDLESMVRGEAALQSTRMRPIMRPIETMSPPFTTQKRLLPIDGIEGKARVSVKVEGSFSWTPDFLERISDRSTRWIVEGQ